MKKSAAVSTATAAATGSIPLWYTGIQGDISSILEGFDPRQHGLASFIHQPPTSQAVSIAEPESPSHLVSNSPVGSSPSPKLNPNKPLNCTSSSHTLVTGNLINGMANSQLLVANAAAAGAIAFPSNAHQQPPQQQTQQQQVQQQQPPQQAQSQPPPGSQANSLQNTTVVNSGVHHLIPQNLLNNPRPKAKMRGGRDAANNGQQPQQSNGITNLSASAQPPLFVSGTSVAFPGNPLQPQQLQQQQQQQNQNFHQQQASNSRQANQMQQQSPQGVLLSSLVNPNGSPNAVRNLANQTSNSISTQNANVALAAAVAAANNPAYGVTSWPCPACKICFRSANELQSHLSAHFVPSQNVTNKTPHLVQSNNFNNSGSGNANQSAQSQQQQQPQQHQAHQHHAFNHNPNVATKKGSDASVHMKKDKSVPCNECGKLFASAERVRVHVRVAHGEKTCACEICGCGFSYRCKLLNHMRTHTGDKPFTCEICGRSFSQKNHLKRHHMIHTGERPFPCEICGRSFYRKDKLTRHRRIHSNTNPGSRRKAATPAGVNAATASMVLNSNAIMEQNRKVDVDVAAAVAVAAANKGISPGITAQSFPPGATIQLIPVSMAAQIGVQRGWPNQLQLPQLAHHGDPHHQRATPGPDPKSPIDARQQSIVGIKL